MGLQLSWVKTKIQAFNDILDDAILSVPVCGDDVEVTERFTYLGSDIHVSTCCAAEVERHLGWAWGVMGCSVVGTYAGRRKFESLSPWCFQSCSKDVRLRL